MHVHALNSCFSVFSALTYSLEEYSEHPSSAVCISYQVVSYMMGAELVGGTLQELLLPVQEVTGDAVHELLLPGHQPQGLQVAAQQWHHLSIQAVD